MGGLAQDPQLPWGRLLKDMGIVKDRKWHGAWKLAPADNKAGGITLAAVTVLEE